MDDLISRRAAIDAVRQFYDEFSDNEKSIEEIIAELPSAQRKGKWIFGVDEETGERDLKAWTCSLCGGKYPWQPNYCPNCGADMKGEEDENNNQI